MGTQIHVTAILGRDVRLGENVVVMEGVHIGDEVRVLNNVVIYPGTTIGDRTLVCDNAVVGRPNAFARTSRHSAERDAMPPLQVGADCIIGAGCVLYWGTRIGNQSMVGDLASVREGCVIGSSTIIGRGVMMECDTCVGDFTKIQTGAHITGNMRVGDHVFIGPHVVTMNDKQMGRVDHRGQYEGPTVADGARVGSNSTILPGVTIGRDAVVGAGAVVVHDVEPGVVAVGVPARPIKPVSPRDRLPASD